MTLNELMNALAKTDPEAALIFEAPSGRTGPGYHVTEFKRAEIASIDCGGTSDAWREAVLQIQDGRGRSHMPVGKFLSIAARSAAALDGLGDLPLRVEFSSGNERLELLNLSAPMNEPGAVIVPLGVERAMCKPLQRAMTPQSLGCCGAGAVQDCCA